MAAAVVAAAAGVSVISSVAAGSSNASSFVPITPCRLFDTRPAADNIGPRAIPLGAGDVFTVDTWGTNGNCTIPSGATALSLNVVAIGPTASSYLTVYPGGNARPTASSLNWTAGQAPTPNAVTAALNGTGQLSFFNLAGSVNIAADVVGYYEPSTSGPAGPTGPTGATGPAGPQGAPGVDPARIVWVATSGGDFTTISAALASITDNDASNRYVIKVAPGTYIENNGIDMKDYVDIEGSGLPTVITSTGTGTNGAAVRFAGTIRSELRDLSVQSSGARGISITTSGDPANARVTRVDVGVSASSGTARAVQLDGGRATLDGVRALVTGSSSGKVAIDIRSGGNGVITRSSATVSSPGSSDACYGLLVEGATVRATDTDVTLSGCSSTSTGFQSFGSTTTIDRARIITNVASGVNSDALVVWDSSGSVDRVSASSVGTGATGSGLYINNSTVIVRSSSFEGNSYGVFYLSGAARLIDSQVLGGTSGMSGRCTDVFDNTQNPYTCA